VVKGLLRLRRLRQCRLWHEGLALGEGGDVGGAAFLFSQPTKRTRCPSMGR